VSSVGVSASKKQPDINQSHRGTVIHRRWTGSKAAVLADEDFLPIFIQREPDEFDENVPYALVLTVGMPSVTEIYDQIRAKVSVQPKVQVRV
jgi:hypothetical protein